MRLNQLGYSETARQFETNNHKYIIAWKRMNNKNKFEPAKAAIKTFTTKIRGDMVTGG